MVLFRRSYNKNVNYEESIKYLNETVEWIFNDYYSCEWFVDSYNRIAKFKEYKKFYVKYLEIELYNHIFKLNMYIPKQLYFFNSEVLPSALCAYARPNLF